MTSRIVCLPLRDFKMRDHESVPVGWQWQPGLALAQVSQSQPPPALGVAGAGTGCGTRAGGTWENHPDCIAVGEAAWRSRFPRSTSPRGSFDAWFPGALLRREGEMPPRRGAEPAAWPQQGGADRTRQLGGRKPSRRQLLEKPRQLLWKCDPRQTLQGTGVWIHSVVRLT